MNILIVFMRILVCLVSLFLGKHYACIYAYIIYLLCISSNIYSMHEMSTFFAALWTLITNTTDRDANNSPKLWQESIFFYNSQWSWEILSLQSRWPLKRRRGGVFNVSISYSRNQGSNPRKNSWHFLHCLFMTIFSKYGSILETLNDFLVTISIWKN